MIQTSFTCPVFGMPLRRLLGLILVLIPNFNRVAHAAGTDPDAASLLLTAKTSWDQGDALGAQARRSMIQEERSSEDVLGLLERQEKTYAEAEDAFREAAAKAKDNPHVWVEYGRFLAARKRYREAADRYYGGLLRADKDPSFKAEERADILRAFGGILERGGQLARAINIYQKAFELAPEDPRNRISLAMGRCEGGEPEAAVLLLRSWAEPAGMTAVAQPLLRAYGLYTLAYAQEHCGYPEDARENYRRAHAVAQAQDAVGVEGIRIEAKGAFRRLSLLLKSFKEDPDAREKYVKAHQLVTEGVRVKASALSDLDTFAKARAKWLSANGEKEREEARREGPVMRIGSAMERFQEALRTYSGCGRAHLELARCHVLMDELKSARAHFEAASVYDPLSSSVLAERGSMHLLFNEWNDARTVFTDLLAIEPESGPAYYGLAKAALMQARNGKDLHVAMDYLDRAEQLGADWKRIDGMRSEIDALSKGLDPSGALPALPSPERTRKTGPQAPVPWKGQGSILDDL